MAQCARELGKIIPILPGCLHPDPWCHCLGSILVLYSKGQGDPSKRGRVGENISWIPGCASKVLWYSLLDLPVPAGLDQSAEDVALHLPRRPSGARRRGPFPLRNIPTPSPFALDRAGGAVPSPALVQEVIHPILDLPKLTGHAAHFVSSPSASMCLANPSRYLPA